MNCPECGARSTEDWAKTEPILPLDKVLEVHVFNYETCGWVSVHDWQWIEDD